MYIVEKEQEHFPEMSVLVFKLQTSERGSPSALSSRHIFLVHHKYLSVARSLEGKRPFGRLRPRG
jgi:hypothetical protein